MSALYLSNLEVLRLPDGGRSSISVDEPLCPSFIALFAGYGRETARQLEPLAGVPVCEESLLPMLLDVVQRAVAGGDPSEVVRLVFCQEWPQPPEETTITMKVKKQGGLKKALTFSLKDQGCATAVTALEMLAVLGEDDASLHNLLVCGDRVTAPQSRVFPDGRYPLGDGAAAMQVRTVPGPFEVMGSLVRTWSTDGDLHGKWEFSESKHLEETWVEEIIRQMGLLQANVQGKDVTYVCVQNVSESFVKSLQIRLDGVVLYTRRYYPYANLSTSDVWYTLYEIEQSGGLRWGDSVLLAFVGPLGAVGTLLLNYHDTPSQDGGVGG